MALTLNFDLTLTFFTGGVILAADYSQLELRVIAHLSGDRKLISILNNDGDVFKMIAAQWKNTLPEAVTTEERQHAKQVCVDCPQQHNHQVFNSQLISACEIRASPKNNFLNDDKYFWTCFAVHLFSSLDYAHFHFFFFFFFVVHVCVRLMTFHCFRVGFLYSPLCSHSTEFSGASKPGLYFCCKVQVFAICLEAVCAFMFLD